jgi:hypothetical protein
VIAILSGAAVWGALAHAQETINQATMSGRVVDSQGAAVPGAMISVRQTETHLTVQAITQTDGRFRFPYLTIGPYELKANLQGFNENGGPSFSAQAPRSIR